MEDPFEVVFHHGGRFIKDGPLRYEGESTILAFDPDVWSYFIIVSVVKGLGYDGFKELWYSVGRGSVLDDKLEALMNDRGALQMMTLARLNGQVHLFVVHTVSEPEIIHLLENVPHNIGEEEVEPVMHGSDDDGGCEQGHEKCQEVGDGECKVPVSEGKMEADVLDGEIEAECDVGESERDDVVQGQIETECHVSESEKDDVVCDVGESEGDNGDVCSWSSSGEDDNVHCNVDVPSMDDLVDCDIQEEVGHGVGNWFGEIEVDVEDDAPSWTRIFDSDEDVGINTENDRGLSDDNWESEELLSGGESDGEDYDQESYGKFVTFSMPKTMVDYKWDLGTYFANKQDILDAIKTYAVENGRNLTYVKNDKKRIRVKCMGAKGKCPWMTYCGYMNAVRTREHKVKLMNSKWLSKRLEKTVRENPKVKVGEIRDKISRKWNVGVSRSMAFREKCIASDHVDGSFKEQYKRIYDYANELLARNPRSTVKVEVEENVSGHIFKRFYVCLKACKDSFVSCRPIIGLDGAFLKGKYGGELLTAIARDANDQMLPLAYAIVQVENKETWKWFLELLVQDIGGEASLTFISDQQKTFDNIANLKLQGLMQAFEEVIPRVDQRFCVRHLYANFRKNFPGKQLKQMMWKAPTATHPQAWETEMTKLKEVNLKAFKYLIKIPPRFTTTTKCDTLVNNMSEAFNSVLVKANRNHVGGDPPLLDEQMGNKLNQESINVWSRLNKESQLTKFWIPTLKLFEVRHVSQAENKFIVDIDKLECTCRKWAISGIPCCHALAAMKFLNLDAEEFILVCFRKSAYEAMYSSIVYPINGENMWQITPYNEVLPPKKRTLPRRPKKKRRLHEWELVRDETRMRKGGIQKRCGICKDLGHNRTSCQKSTQDGEVNPDQTQQSNQTNEENITSSN
ncbi:hypothetical protein V8G54_009909 [Vigna mungo]|uniref:SWIM-type domain-containing protein n=1 Tax=Vigna mungo TaxID=3915 RepID=A0AAQ3NY50_VIGMU